MQRIPLPGAEMLEEEPLYVNAKQYHRILKRRQARAKLEAEGKIPKERRVGEELLCWGKASVRACTGRTAAPSHPRESLDLTPSRKDLGSNSDDCSLPVNIFEPEPLLLFTCSLIRCILIPTRVRV